MYIYLITKNFRQFRGFERVMEVIFAKFSAALVIAHASPSFVNLSSQNAAARDVSLNFFSRKFLVIRNTLTTVRV